MKSLPNVTLISYDNTDDPTRTLRALRYCASLINFAAVICVCRGLSGVKGNDTADVECRFVSERGYPAAMVWEVAGVRDYINTDFALCIHPDGYILNAAAWNDDWLRYDFIGAPWPLNSHPYHPGKSDYPNSRVGNTGFCIKSIAFLDQTSKLRKDFIQWSQYPDQYGQQWGGDTFTSQHQRPMLESIGIKFAPVEVAARFSWESNIEEVPGDRPYAFGFHNFNHENKQVHRV